MSRPVLLPLVAFFAVGIATHLQAADGKNDSSTAPSLADFLSPAALAYVEITNPTPLLAPALANDLETWLEPLEAYGKYRASKDYRDFTAVVRLLERKLDTNWRDTVRNLLGGGVAVAFEPQDQAAVILVRSRNPDELRRLHDAILELAEADARNKGVASPIKSVDYRGVTRWLHRKDGVHALIGDTLVVSNKDSALTALIDRRLDRKASLVGDEVFNQVRRQAGERAAGFGFVRLGPLKLLAGLSKLLGQKSDNPPAELFAGGVVDALAQADYLGLSIDANGDRWKISLRLPRDSKRTAATRRWYFAPRPEESADAPLIVPNLLASLTTYRDVSGFWTNRTELFDEETNVGFTEADTNLGLYFSGRDFGTQVLAEIEPQWQFVSALHDFAADGGPVPALQLPNLAVVWRLKHPNEFAPHLQMAFQNIIGITNLNGVQQGHPQLLLKSETRGAAEIHYGTYLTVGETPSTQAPVYFNFRPACARVGSHFVLGTHVALVRNLATALESAPAKRTTRDNLRFEVQAAPLEKIIDANRTLILGRAMLSSGGDTKSAEQQLDLGLRLLKRLERFSLRLVDEADAVSLETELRFHP